MTWHRNYKYPPSGVQVYDVDGALWNVREARETKHGFDLLFGSLENAPLTGQAVGLPRLIATRALWDYWERTRTTFHSEIYDLPAGRTTIKRLRKRLGFNQKVDVATFFRKRIDDLRNLGTRQFVERHGMNNTIVNYRRLRMVGRKARALGWWQDEKVMEILRSPLTHGRAGAKLGIKTSQVSRLRRRIREAETGVTEPVRKMRPPDWWKEETVLAILRSPMAPKEAGEKLGVSGSRVARLRKRLTEVAEPEEFLKAA